MRAAATLTQHQARRRAALLAVSGYEIFIDLSGARAPARTFTTTTTVRFGCRVPGVDTFIECAAERVLSATLNGAAVDISAWSSSTGLPLSGIAEDNVLVVRAEFGYASGQRGMFRAVDPADGSAYVYSSFEPAAAQRVFACFDQPDLKARFTWHATVPEGWRAISNMPPGATEQAASGAVTIHFPPSPRMSSYLAVLCAGPFVEVRSVSAGRDLGIFCRESMIKHLDADDVFELTRRGMAFFERQFDQPYPLPKLDYVAAPEYRGAMENFGCVVISERDFVFRSRTTNTEPLRRGAVLMHELAHMWFGDLVTMRWWDDLWLNEAFATWASYWCLHEATDLDDPWADFAVQHKARGLKADQDGAAHPVYSVVPDVDTAEVAFDDITYRKGASVIKQLAAYIGIEAFVAALRRYFRDHAWGNATFDDLVRCLESVSGRSLGRYVNDWLRTAQANTLRLEVSLDARDVYTNVAVLQEAPPAYPTLRTHRIDVGIYDRAPAGLTLRDRVELEVTGARTPVPQLSGQPRADALLLDDRDLTFARLRLDDRSWPTIRDHVSAFPGKLQRAVCWASCIDMVHSAELPAREFVAMVSRCLPSEADGALAGTVLLETDFAIDYFAAVAWVSSGRALVATAARTAAYAMEPASARQLMWARAFCGSARSLADLDLLRAWLDGTETPPGLAIDADLRWQVLHSLVALGAADRSDVEREFARDRSVGGLYAVSAARALIPTQRAKEAAWQAALAPGTSVTIRRSILTSFWHPAHAALTEPYLARYFDALETIWHEQGDEAGRCVAAFGFPATHVSGQTVAAADTWCSGDRPASLKKVVGVAATRMRRALAARARDASSASPEPEPRARLGAAGQPPPTEP